MQKKKTLISTRSQRSWKVEEAEKQQEEEEKEDEDEEDEAYEAESEDENFCLLCSRSQEHNTRKEKKKYQVWQNKYRVQVETCEEPSIHLFQTFISISPHSLIPFSFHPPHSHMLAWPRKLLIDLSAKCPQETNTNTK